MILSSFQRLRPSKAEDGILPKNIGVSLTPPTLPIDGGGRGRGEEVRIGTVPEVCFYTHVSMKSLGKIMSPLDTLELAKGGDE